MKISPRLSRALRPNRVHVGSVSTTATLDQLRLSCPGLSDQERQTLMSGQGVTRYFRSTRNAIQFYCNIYGDDHPGWGFPRVSHTLSRWHAGHARKWYPVYACLTLKGVLATENS